MARSSPQAPFRSIPALLATAIIALVQLGVAHAQPALSRIEPGALVAGQTVEIKLHGAKLAEPLQVWSSFPATWEILPGDPSQTNPAVAKVKATLEASTPPGIGGIAITTAEGPSEILLVPVDDLPSVAEAANNHTTATAQEITPPSAVDGICDAIAFDYFKFRGTAGQAISLEVLGSRLGSDFDPVVRLLDSAGRQLLLADDDPALGADCRFRYTLPAEGEYIVELRDNRYKGGGRYRLRIGNFPIVSTAFPLSVRTGESGPVGFAGPTGDSIDAVAPSQTGKGPTALAARMPGGNASAFASVVVDDLPGVVEAPGTATPVETPSIALPCAISGKIDEAGDQDEYRFSATKDSRVRFRAWTRSLGSPALVRMSLLDGSGKRLAESPVNENDEEAISFVIPADGEYRLAVEELVGRGGNDYTYRIEARLGPAFSLRLKNVNNQPAKLSLAMPAGSARDLTVECVRDDYDGPITLSLESPKAGWQVFNNTIPEKGKEARLFIVAPADLQPGEYVPLQIVGKADIGGSELAATISTTVQMRAARPQLPYPPLWLDGLLSVGGVPAKPAFYEISADKPELSFPRLIGQAEVILTFDRLDAAYKDQPLTVVPLQLPPGLALAEVKRNGNGPKETYNLILRGAKDLPEGKHAFKFLTYGEHAGSGLLKTSEIPVTIVTPVAVSLSPAGALTQGQPQKVKILVNRQGDDQQPVVVKFKKLPAGVIGPAEIKLEADQNEAELELTAAADAPVGTFDDIAVSAATKYAGQDLSADSPNISLEVKAP